MAKRTESDKKLSAVSAPAPRDPSRMMGLLIVDVLAARKATTPARKPATATKKTAKG